MLKTEGPIVFIVADLTLRGGIERVLVNTVNYLSSLGVSCKIVSIFKTHAQTYYTISNSVEVIYLSSISFSRVKHWILPAFLISWSSSLIDKPRPYRLVVYHPSYIVPITQACNIKKSSIIYSEHMSFDAANSIFSLIRKLILNWRRQNSYAHCILC